MMSLSYYHLYNIIINNRLIWVEIRNTILHLLVGFDPYKLLGISNISQTTNYQITAAEKELISVNQPYIDYWN